MREIRPSGLMQGWELPDGSRVVQLLPTPPGLPPRNALRAWLTDNVGKKFMVHNLFLIVVVVFRALGLYYAGSAVLGFIVGAVLTRGMMGASPLMVLLLPLIGGILLWVLAQPCAALMTRDLE